MDKKKFINDAYEQLLAAGRVISKKDLADKLDINYQGLVSAMNGKEQYLTESLCSKVSKFLNDPDGADPRVIAIPSDRIPLIPIEAVGGTLQEFSQGAEAYECEQIISPVKGAGMAMMVTGDSMAPDYPSGSKVLLQTINEEAFIEWGCVYVLDTENGAVIKRVREADDGTIICESINPAFPPFRIKRKYIHGWWKVLMVMTLK